jgi:formylglycine-generating enzyme required for sulfatase activity
MKQLILLISMGLLLISTTVTAADRVQQVKAMQQGNRMVLEYTLAGDKPTTVSFSVTANGKKYTADSLHLEGDYGKNVAPGKRRLVWNVLQDFPRGLRGQVDWSLTAAGGGGGTDPTTGMEFVAVPSGCFQMGDSFGDGDADEKPVHQVCVSDFSIGKYEVTQGQWKAVMGSNPSHFSRCGDNCPVEKVSWDDAQQFIQRMNSQSGTNYRLPTEAEWEYACRSAGRLEKYCGGNDVDAVAWYSSNSGRKTHPVGQKQPNGLGIYDMSGNVWEWCSDWYGEKYYGSSSKDNPQGASSGTYRVLRGGSWGDLPVYVRAASRSGDDPGYRNGGSGFRLVASQD